MERKKGAGVGKGYELGPGVLDGIRSKLGDARGQIEGLSGSVPHGVDAGLLTGPIEAVLSSLVENAAQFSTALGGVADDVDASKKDYDRVETDAKDRLHRVRGGK
ncbi:hypothetical protein [Sciscionella marina]|uniref:hypothetical protein n=1 Tax=Sciscionella marina TaxID=508770 RepID=UPI00058FBF20|nr:hypothetical protein [Sciscionella marina]